MDSSYISTYKIDAELSGTYVPKNLSERKIDKTKKRILW